MTRRLMSLALFGLGMCLFTSEAEAFGFKKHAPCPSDCASPCATPCTVTYVDKKVTCYKMETEVKDVKVMVSQMVQEPVKYKYFECVPVVTKKKVMVQEQRTKEEPFKYTVMVPTVVKEKVKVCSMVPVTKDVEVTVFETVTTMTKQKRIVCETICVPVTVCCTVPVAPAHERHGLFGHCCKKHDDCAPPCPPEPCYQTITKTVVQRQVVTKEIVVDVPVCTRVPKKVMQKVTTSQPVWTEKDVEVTKCVPVEKTGMRPVCFYVPVEKEISVTTTTQVEKEGTRMVSKCVPVEKIVKQTFCKTVPYETIVKVAVYTPAPAPAPCPPPCAAPCDTCGSVAHIGHRMGGGILHGCCHKCK